MINEYINAYPAGISLNDVQRITLENSGIDSYHQLKLQLDNKYEIQELTDRLNILIQQHISLSSAYRSVDGYKGSRSVPTQVDRISIEQLLWEEPSEPDFKSIAVLTPSIINAKLSKNIQVIEVTTSDSTFLILRVSALVMDIASLVSFSQQLFSSDLFDDVLQFPDFIQWRNELFNSEEGLQGQAYWQHYISEQLAYTPALDIADLVTSGAEYENMLSEYKLINLDNVALAAIEQTAYKCNVSTSTVITGTWWLLLARLTAQSQFNSFWHCDPKQDDEALFDAVGMFQSVLPVAIKIEEKDDFSAWIQKLHTQLASHKDWAECLDANKIKDITIATGAGYIDMPGDIADNVIDINAENFAQINLHCFNMNGKLKLSLSYQKQAVNVAMVEQLLKQYFYLLSSSEEYLSKSVMAINLVSPDEKKQLLTLDNRVTHQRVDSISMRLNHYSESQPDTIALMSDDTQYNYQELAIIIDKCASQLVLLGLKETEKVGICLAKSCDLVIAMLAVMRAGGTYIPLDPQWPVKRVNQVVNQAKPRFIFADKTPLVADIEHLFLRDLTQATDEITDLPTVTNDNTAYMIYTSGTTGEPKGVCIGHKQLNQYCYASSKALSLNENKHFAMTSTISADLGYTSLFNALYNGACLHIATDEQVNDANKFRQFLINNEIDCIKIVPSHFMALIDDDATSHIPNKIIFGGEAAPENLIKSLFNKSNEVEIYNHYGPTESTVGVMYHQFINVEEDRFYPRLTGVFEGSGAVILNEFNDLCSIGELGELHVFGTQLASQYFNQPIESGFKINHSLADKIYPTGDLARYLIDGGVMLAGRKDDQIKIRGFRVEPDEVAHHINAFSDIERAVVIGENNNLIAYIVNSNSEAGLLDSDLKQQYIDKLSQDLPHFMIPSHWLSINKLPLLGNGKINKNLLPNVNDFNESAISKPVNSLETLICDVMQDLLEVKQISTTQCFLDLGAHSLTVIKFVTRLRKLLMIEVEPIMVFENSNVVKLAKVLNNLGSEPSKLEKLAAMQLKLATLDIEQQQQLRRKLLL